MFLKVRWSLLFLTLGASLGIVGVVAGLSNNRPLVVIGMLGMCFFNLLGIILMKIEERMSRFLGSDPWGLPVSKRKKWVEMNQPVVRHKLFELAIALETAQDRETTVIKNTDPANPGPSAAALLTVSTQVHSLAREFRWIQIVCELYGFQVKNHHLNLPVEVGVRAVPNE